MIRGSLGAKGPTVSAIGLGCMGMSDLYGPADEAESVATIRAALDAGVTLLKYSLISRGIEKDILPAARELGVGITAYGVLSRGLLSGRWSRERAFAAGDFRAWLPRFTGENLDHNLTLVEWLRELANEKGVTVAQLAIAWVLSRGDDIGALVGARRRDRLAEALSALAVELTPQDVARLEAAVPPDSAAGTRYDTHQMQILDSERGRSGAP